MKLYTINATPVQSHNQMVQSGYRITDENSVAHINKLNIEEYPLVVADILDKHGVDGFTMYQVQGYWEGESEVSFKIEVALDDELSETIGAIAKDLRDMYNQDSVMVTYPDNHVEFI